MIIIMPPEVVYLGNNVINANGIKSHLKLSGMVFMLIHIMNFKIFPPIT